MDTILKKLPYWEFLSEYEKQILEKGADIYHYQESSILHRNINSNSDFSGMIYLIQGEIRVYTLSDEGREITIFRLFAGESYVYSDADVNSHINFEIIPAVTKEADILTIPASVFRQLTKDNVYVRCFMYEMKAKQYSDVMCIMHDILLNSFEQRLAAFLLNEYYNTEKNEIKMTHEQIAQNVNSAREVVSRMLKKFASDELVENYRGKIILKNIEGLEKLK